MEMVHQRMGGEVESNTGHMPRLRLACCCFVC